MATATKSKTTSFDPAIEQEKFSNIFRYLSTVLPERDTEIELALIAMLSRQHYIMLGPSGEGKSFLIKQLMECFTDVVYADKTLTASTEYDDLFGFPDSNAISEGKMIRTFEGTIAMVHVVGLHEIGKCSDILRTTLMEYFNERSLDNYDHKVETPLMSAICSSNELPSKVIGFTNRFAIKNEVERLSWDGREALANAVNSKAFRPINPKLKITLDDLIRAQNYVASYQLPKSMIAAMVELCKSMEDQHVTMIDTRKWLWAMGIMRANVFLDGADPHYGQMKVLKDVLWDNPRTRSKVSKFIEDYISRKSDTLTSLFFED